MVWAKAGVAQASERGGFLLDDLVEERLVVLALEGSLARDHLIQHAAQCPDVRAGVDLHALRLFGRHVGDSPHRGIDLRQARSLSQPRQPEVHDGGVTLGVD